MKSIGLEEVYLWRGSPEQRAQRSLDGKWGRFGYFDRQLHSPDWAGRKVLDFGGNEGTLLLDSNGRINASNYYCLDVIKEALEEGRNRFPEAHWIRYNRYNCSFNPEGIKGLPIPDPGVEFDFILAYSVFTHTTKEDMHSFVEQLVELLAAGGTLAFTFVDPNYEPRPGLGSNLRFRLERHREINPAIDVDRLLNESRGAAWCALVNGSELYVNANGVWNDDAQSCLSYNVYYTVDFLQQEFPNAAIRVPIAGELQHCCVLRR